MMKKIWRFLAKGFIKILLSAQVKKELKLLWEQINDFEVWYKHFTDFLKKL